MLMVFKVAYNKPLLVYGVFGLTMSLGFLTCLMSQATWEQKNSFMIYCCLIDRQWEGYQCWCVNMISIKLYNIVMWVLCTLCKWLVIDVGVKNGTCFGGNNCTQTQTHIYTQRTYQINQTYDDNLGNAYDIKFFSFNDTIKNVHILAPFTKASYRVRSSYNIKFDGFITWSTIFHTIV